MINREKTEKLSIIYLVIGILGFLMLFIDATFRELDSPPFYFHLASFWHGVFFLFFVMGHLLYFENLSETRELYNVEEVLKYFFLTGLITLPLSSLPGIFYQMNLRWQLSPLTFSIYNIVCNYFYVFYFISGLVLFRKLIFVKGNRFTYIVWNTFLFLLIFSLIFNFTGFHIPKIFSLLFLATGGVLGALLLYRIQWIANLKYKNKLISIVYLLVINLISLRFTIKFIFSIDNSNLFSQELVNNVFMLLTVSMVNAYGILSMIALIFNLPIASFMEQKEGEMSGFQEITKIIQKKFKVEDILETMFNSCFHNTLAEGGWVEMVAKDNDKILKKTNVSEEEIKEITRSVVTFKLLHSNKDKKYFYANNLDKNEDFFNVETSFQSLVVFPVLSKNVLVGRIYLLKSFKNGFDEYMLNLINTYSDQAKLAFENSELLKETLETERLKQEMKIARNVQKSLLPQRFPDNLYFDISAVSESAREVGGDYYDFYSLDKNNYAVIIGDVSGKGTSAVFHMAEMKGIFQTLVPGGLNPYDFLTELNKAVSRCFDKNLFITLSYFLIHCYQHKITFSRAGHCPLLYYHAKEKKSEYYKEGGIGIGIVRNESFHNYIHVNEIRFYSKDIMILFTDGLTDAREKGSGNEYGYERLQTQLEKYAHLPAEEIKDNIINDLKSFVHDAPAMDDLTLMIIKFK